jgi:hypothetical protein
MSKEPQTLIEAIRYFSDPDACLALMVGLRWPDGVVRCPTCGSDQVTFLPRRLWQCKTKHARQQFSIKVGTIFEDSPIGLDKWLSAMWMIANDKNGISSYEVSRALGVTQKTAWFLMHRIRLAMEAGTFDKMDGTVEADETFIGGNARFMHKDKRAAKIKGTGGMGKVAVMGLLDRHGPDGHSVVRTSILANRRRQAVSSQVRQHVKRGSEVMTDALQSYNDLSRDFIHGVIDHAESYVDGRIHTNGIENFWSLLKRGIKGTYVSVERFHLFRYLDEQVFRFNTRKATDGARFLMLAARVVGRRLTYNQLTGRTPA